MTGDILSVGNELFVDVDLTQTKKEHFQLKQISSNRLDLKILSIEEHHSDLYTCMFNDQKLFSYSIQVFGNRINSLSCFLSLFFLDRNETRRDVLSICIQCWIDFQQIIKINSSFSHLSSSSIFWLNKEDEERQWWIHWSFSLEHLIKNSFVFHLKFLLVSLVIIH